MTKRNEIYITDADFDKLADLVDLHESSRPSPLISGLARQLERAVVVGLAEIGPKVVTMNSTARVLDHETNEVRTITLVYPRDEDSLRGKVCVLTPFGGALLGMSAGRRTSWRTVDGRTKDFSVLEVVHQPETAFRDQPRDRGVKTRARRASPDVGRRS